MAELKFEAILDPNRIKSQLKDLFQPQTIKTNIQQTVSSGSEPKLSGSSEYAELKAMYGKGDSQPQDEQKPQESEEKSEGIVSMLGSIGKMLGPLAVLKEIKFISDFVKILVGFIGLGILMLLKGIINGVKAVVEWVKELPAFIEALPEKIGEFITNLWSTLKEQFPFLQRVEDAVKLVWAKLIEFKDLAMAFFKDPVGVFKQGLMFIWEYMKEKFPFLEKIEEAIKFVRDRIIDGWEKAKEFFTPLKEKVFELFNKIVEFVKPFVSFIATALAKFFNDPIGTLKSALQFVWNVISDLPSKIWNFMTKLPSLIANALKKVLTGGLNPFRKESIEDAIITKTGKVIHTDPNDMIFATKNPQGMGGSKTINLYGVMPSEVIQYIKREFASNSVDFGRF